MDIDAAAAEAYKQPFPVEVNVEAIMARHIVVRVLVVGPAIIAAAWLLRGSLGAFSATIGVVVVALNFLLAGWILSKAARVSMQAYHVATLVGFVVRLAVITISMLVAASLFEIDRRAFGVAAVAAFLILLSLESIAMLRGARKELEWS